MSLMDSLAQYNRDIVRASLYNFTVIAFAGGPFINSPSFGYRD